MHVDWNSWLEMVSGKGREETVPFIRFLGETGRILHRGKRQRSESNHGMARKSHFTLNALRCTGRGKFLCSLFH